MDTFEAVLEQDKDGTWFYVHVPLELRQKHKVAEKRGIIAVRATIGGTTWDGSLLPWADGSAQLSVNKKVRAAEGLAAGDRVVVSVALR